MENLNFMNPGVLSIKGSINPNVSLENIFGSQNNQIPRIQKVIFNYPATIIFWKDGTKTVTRVHEEHGDRWMPEFGIAMCYMKKIFGGYDKFMKVVNKNLEKNNQF
jgi:hypothetical protein